MKFKSFFALAALALMLGCGTPSLNTPSGTNEVTIAAPVKLVRQELAAEIANRGYSIVRADDFTIEASQDAGMAAAVFLATPANPTAQKLARFNIMETPQGVRVILRNYIIAGGVDRGEVTGGRDRAQAFLESIKARLEH